MKLRTLIVDDEPPARERLRRMLSKEPCIELIGECGDGAEALSFIRKESLELLFLDVQMPELDGFSLLQKLDREQLPIVIFTTAFDEHAVRAFEAHAIDYLLKPFKAERLHDAIQRASEYHWNKSANELNNRIVSMLDAREEAYLARLTVRDQGNLIILRVAEIDCFESAGNYVVARSRGKEHVLRDTLTALEEQLDPKKFVRISRSAIVCLDAIKKLTPAFNGDYSVVLSDGKNLSLTRGRRMIEQALRYS